MALDANRFLPAPLESSNSAALSIHIRRQTETKHEHLQSKRRANCNAHLQLLASADRSFTQNVNASSPPVYATPRRSRRIWFTMPIGVSCLLSERLAWTEETSTLVVNAHGALILLNHEVVVGQTLTISDLRSSSERKCRVVMIGAKTSGMNEVGIELLQPFDDLWRVPNAPSDWAQFASAGKLLA
jgi:hypothetical protein